MTPRVLLEDNHLLAIDKPAGLPSAHADGDAPTADRWAKQYLRNKYQKPGNVFVGVVHRLDRVTSGVLLFARTSKAAARLSEQFRLGSARKVYWAVTVGREWPPAGTFRDWLRHDDPARLVRVVPPGTPGGKPAETAYRVLAMHAGRTLLELKPRTGRKHQLRVQLASRGGPIVGDEKYGSPLPLGDAVALHARSLTVTHPTRAETVSLTAELPPHWKPFAELLRGVS